MLGVRNLLNSPSCVYVWVMNHLGVVFSDAFGLFWGFGWIFGKMDEISKFGQFRGPTSRCRDPTQQHKSTLRHGMSTPRRGGKGGLDKPRVSRGVAKLHRDEGLRRNVVVLRRGIATIHKHVFLLCFAIPLF